MADRGQRHVNKVRLEAGAGRGKVRDAQVGAAVLALVDALDVLEAAGWADHRSAGPYSTTQVSPLTSSWARSPAPWRATASSIWPTITWSWVGGRLRRRTPAGPGAHRAR